MDLTDEGSRGAIGEQTLLGEWHAEHEVVTTVEELLENGPASVDEAKKETVRQWLETHKRRIQAEQNVDDPSKKAA